MYRIINLSWIVCYGALVGLAGWLALDGMLEKSIYRLQETFGAMIANRSFTSVASFRSIIADIRMTGLMAVAVLVIVGFSGIAVGLFHGLNNHRSTRAWLSLTGLIAAWICLSMQWENVSWMGRSCRMSTHVTPQLVHYVNQLEDNWPASDGISPELGPYLAYPIYRPSVLMLLSEATLPNTNLKITAIEKTVGKSLRFELAGSEQGNWLEYRSDTSTPESFTGGLEQELRLKRFSRLDSHWYLVKYQVR